MEPIRGRVIRHLVSLALILLALDRLPAAAGTPAPGFEDSPVVSGLAAPIALAFLPDGSLLIAEQGGALKLFDGTATQDAGHPSRLLRLGDGTARRRRRSRLHEQRLHLSLPDEAGPGRLWVEQRALQPGGARHHVRWRGESRLAHRVALGDRDRRRQPRRGHAPHRARPQALGVGRRHGAGRQPGRPGLVDESVRAEPRLAQRQDPAPEPRRQRARRQSVREHARRAPRDLGVRVPQPVPHELRRADRAAVDRRRGRSDGRGDRPRGGRRELQLAALRGTSSGPGHRAPAVRGRKRHRPRLHLSPQRPRVARLLRHRRRVRRRRLRRGGRRLRVRRLRRRAGSSGSPSMPRATASRGRPSPSRPRPARRPT